jgi:hypothetical protein
MSLTSIGVTSEQVNNVSFSANLNRHRHSALVPGFSCFRSRKALFRRFSVSVKAKGSSPGELDSSRPILCTEQSTIVATFGRHGRLVLSFQMEK